MLKWAVILAAVLLTTIMFGLSGVAVSPASLAKILFCVFLVMFVASLLIGLLDVKAIERE